MKYIFLILCFFCSLSHGQMANTSSSPLSLATYTATTVNSTNQQNFNYRGGHFIINVVTVNSGTYTPHIQGYDPTSGIWYDILVGTAISSPGLTVLKIYPGITAASNVSVSDILPQIWRVQLIGGSTPSIIISVDAYLEL